MFVYLNFDKVIKFYLLMCNISNRKWDMNFNFRDMNFKIRKWFKEVVWWIRGKGDMRFLL